MAIEKIWDFTYITKVKETKGMVQQTDVYKNRVNIEYIND